MSDDTRMEETKLDPPGAPAGVWGSQSLFHLLMWTGTGEALINSRNLPTHLWTGVVVISSLEDPPR